MKLKKCINKMIFTLVSSSMFVSSNLNATAMDTLLEIPANVFQVVWAVAGLTLLIPIYVASLVYDGDRHVSKDKRFKHILYKTYVLNEDMIYGQYGENSERNPRTVGYFHKNWGGEESAPHLLKAGTKITIYKIFEHKSIGLLSHNHLKVIAAIEEGTLSGYMVDIGDFLTEDCKYGQNFAEFNSSKLELIEI
jgi:hypothetical protein